MRTWKNMEAEGFANAAVKKKAIHSDGSIRLLVKIRRFSKATGFRVWFFSDLDFLVFQDRIGFVGRTGLGLFFNWIWTRFFSRNLDWLCVDLDRFFSDLDSFTALTETNV